MLHHDQYRSWLLLLLLLCTAQPAVQAADDPLIMGIFPRRNVTITVKHFKPLADYLSHQLGRTVKLETASDFPSFWQHVSQQRYDLVHFNQYHYVESHKKFGYHVIVRNEEFGRATLAGAIVVRKDSGINQLSDLKGRSILFGGGKKAMVAYVATTYLLREAGLKPGDYTESFATNPPNACIGTFLRRADAGGVGDIILKLPIIKRRIDTEELRFLAIGQQLPHIPWAVRDDMPDAVRNQIRQIMTTMHESPHGQRTLARARITRFHPAQDADYNVIRKMIKTVNKQEF